MIMSFKIAVLIVLIVVGVVSSIRTRVLAPGQTKYSVITSRLLIAAAVVLVYLLLIPSIGVVETGERGIVLRFGAFTGRTLSEGIYVVTPLVERVEIMSVQVRAFEADADSASKDLQVVKTSVTLNYSLDPGKVDQVYRDLRRDYEFRIIKPAVQEAVKAATAQFEAERLIGQRQVVKDKIEQSLRDRLGKFGIMVNAVSITDFAFSRAFNDAIEAKVAAAQQAAKAERDLERVRMEAQQKIEQAKAEAESLRIQKGNVTPEMIKLRQIEVQKAAVDKWDGKMPQVSSGDMPFIMNLNP